jgi:streptogramin lyase
MKKAGLIAGLVTFLVCAAPAAAKKGDLIVAAYADNALVRVDPSNGAVSEIYGGDETDSISYVTLEPNGNAVVTDENGGGVWRIDLGNGGISELAPGQFTSPYGIDRAPDGSLHVADYNTGLLSRIDKAGGLSTIAADGDGVLTDSTYGIDVLTNRNSLVSQTSDPEGVVQVTPGGATSLFISHPELSSPQDVSRVANGDVYVLDGDGGDLFRFNAKTGQTSLVVPDAGDGSSYSLAPAPDGTVYVSSFDGLINRVDPKTDEVEEILPESELESIVGMELEPPKCKGKTATIVGSTKKDKLKGSKFKDVIHTLGGNDKVNAKGGNDIVCGGKGKDKLKGGKGKDKLLGQAGKDKLDGGPGKDSEQQ